MSDLEELVDRHVLRDRIWTALDDLEEEERTTLVLRHFTRCRTYESIAVTTGVPVGTVRSRLSRARRRLLAALASDTGADRDQARLEASRRDEWESFYRELQKVPEPPTYLDLYRRDVTVRDSSGQWHGLDAWSAEERDAIQIGVRATLGGLVAGRDLTALEIHFHNPPQAPGHCPPSATFVHRLLHGRSARVDIHYHASSAAGDGDASTWGSAGAVTSPPMEGLLRA
jgi:RNA polymerase sigma-70 factor (ECF subfamily)